MKLTEIILDNFAPQNLRALWLQPKPNKTVAFKVFNNGVWMDTFEWQDLSGFLTKEDAADTYQPKGEYQPAGNYALKSELPSYTTVPELTDDYTIPANATTREFIYEIPVGATVYNITGASGIKWAGGTAPAVQANKTYLIRVIHNLATWTEF